MFLFNQSFAQKKDETVEENIYLTRISYFFEILKEKIRLFTTFGAKNRAKLLLEFAQRRIEEYKVAQKQGKDKFAQSLLQMYENNLKKAVDNMKLAQENNEDISDLTEEAAKITQKNLKILVGLYSTKMPPKAKEKLSQAIGQSQKFYETTKEILSGKKREAIQKQAKKYENFFERKIKYILKKLWPIMK